MIIQSIDIDSHVFRMRVKDLRPKFLNRFDRVDQLHPQVGGVVVQAEMIRGDRLEHAPPDCWSAGEIQAERPSIGKEHGTIFDSNANVLRLGVTN